MLLLRLFLIAAIYSGSVSAGVSVETYIPSNAYKYLPVLKTEISKRLPSFKYPTYFAGLIEQESCISLTHSRCWKPDSELKTSREQGVGLGQITRAWDSNGKLRFDSLSDLKNRYYSELKEANWSNIKYRPDLQIRMILIMVSNSLNYYKQIPDLYQRLAFADSAYNGGTKLLDKERITCGLVRNCDPNIWFNNTEKQNSRGTKVLYGTRTAFGINREHVRNIFLLRAKVGSSSGKYNNYL
jgi:hypothetical protein